MPPQIHMPRKPSSAISFHCAMSVVGMLAQIGQTNGARIRQAKDQRNAASVHGGTVSTAGRPMIRFDTKNSGMTARMTRSRGRVVMTLTTSGMAGGSANCASVVRQTRPDGKSSRWRRAMRISWLRRTHWRAARPRDAIRRLPGLPSRTEITGRNPRTVLPCVPLADDPEVAQGFDRRTAADIDAEIGDGRREFRRGRRAACSRMTGWRCGSTGMPRSSAAPRST